MSDDPYTYLEAFRDRIHSRIGRASALHLASLTLATRDAQLDWRDVDPARAGLFDGTSRDNFGYWVERVETEAARSPEERRYTKRDLVAGMPGIGIGMAAALLGVQGPTYTFSGSCCSGAIAIGHAHREIESGEIDVALAGGHDAALIAPLFGMYDDAGLLSREREDLERAVRPYGGDTGNAFGEGAVTLVLESREHAERRGAPILASIGGYGYANGGRHPTHVDQTGERPAHLIRKVLEQSELGPGDVDFVLGHGNGVAQSDQSELAYMREVFGGLSREVPLASTKSIYGHTLGASSAVNVAAAVLMVHHGQPYARAGASGRGVGVSVGFGIGGNNTAVLVRDAGGAREASAN